MCVCVCVRASRQACYIICTYLYYLILPWLLLGCLAFVPVEYRNQWEIRGRKAPNFDWTTFGWASCNIDTFVPNV